MSFVSKVWKNLMSGGTPLNAGALNDLEGRIADAVAEADEAIVALSADTADAAEIASRAVDAFTPDEPVVQPVAAFVMSTFQSGHGFTESSIGSSFGADASDFIVGAQSLRTVTNGSGGESKPRRTGLPARDFSGKAVRIAYKIENLAHLASAVLYLGHGNFAGFWTAQLYSNSFFVNAPVDSLDSVVRDGEWVVRTIPLSMFNPGGAAPDWTAITDVQLLVKDDNTGNPVVFRVNKIEGVPA